MVKVGERIRQARKRKQVTQEELATSIGISDKSISAYESNRINPPLKVLEKIAEKMGQPISYFVEDTIETAILAKLSEVERQFKEIKDILLKFKMK
jgi:transcriptional regulator with XRE-family HTH domain